MKYAINFNESMVFTEAVFSSGRESMEPIVKSFQKIKDILEEKIKEHQETSKEAEDAKKKAKSGEPIGNVKVRPFNPESFWRQLAWKDLEDEIQKVFGFRVVKINPYNEKYLPAKDIFESNELNAYVYRKTRYPVDALITDKGLYDKSHSLDLEVHISLGLLRNFTAAEIMATLLHEIGHSIDPALCDIKYTGTNVLCKYITDRKGAINKEEQKVLNDAKKSGLTVLEAIGVGIGLLPLLVLIGSSIASGAKKICSSIRDLFIGKEGRRQKQLEKIQSLMQKDTIKFTRQEYTEAFADNFARMYGFGPEMASVLKKLSKDVDKRISRIEKEKRREEVIFNITEAAIKDIHKTDVHRVKALIREYNNDINDPNVPLEVKKQLMADVKEVELVLDQFMNDFDKFQNRINKMISDELDKIEPTKEPDEKK